MKPEQISYFPTPEAWHAWRSEGIGASDVAVLLGLTPWSSPYALWAEKVGLVERDQAETNESMEFGKEAEDMLARYFEKRTDLFVGHRQLCIEHESLPWMRATLDGLVYENKFDDDAHEGEINCLGIFESKTTGDSPDDWAEKIPVYYQCQVNYSMHISGLEHAFLGVLHLDFGRPKFRVYELDYDPAGAMLMEERAAEFYQHIVSGEAPELDGREATGEALKSIYKGDEEESRTVIDDLLVAQYASLKKQIKGLEEASDLLGNKIRLALGDSWIGVSPTGEKLITWKPGKKTSVDLDGLRAVAPELVETFTDRGTQRTLRLATAKKEKATK